MRKFSQVILHIGSDKTGSTAVQDVLEKNHEKLLREASVNVPPKELSKSIGANFYNNPANYPFYKVNGIESGQAKLKAKEAMENFYEWLDKATPTEKLVLSYEGYMWISVNGLKKMRDFLESIAKDVYVLYYVRPPLSFAKSAFTQGIKSGRDLPEQPPVRDHKEILEKVEEVFGKKSIIIRKYDKSSLLNGCVIDDFLSACGVYANLQKGESAVNKAPSSESVALAKAINCKLKEKGIYDEFFPQRFVDFFGDVLYRFGEKPFSLKKEQEDAVLKKSFESIDYIREKYNINLNERRNQTEPGKSFECDKYCYELVGFWLEEKLNFNDVQGYIKLTDYPEQVEAKNKFLVKGELCNMSSEFWIGTKESPINIAFYWDTPEDREIQRKPSRVKVKRNIVAPGEKVLFEFYVEAPEINGNFCLCIDIVREQKFWFSAEAFSPGCVEIQSF